jgi:hypothetical protein
MQTETAVVEADEADVTVIDAAMSGAQPAAEAGELTFIVGGDEAALPVTDDLKGAETVHALQRRFAHGGPAGVGVPLESAGFRGLHRAHEAPPRTSGRGTDVPVRLGFVPAYFVFVRRGSNAPDRWVHRDPRSVPR